MIQSLIYFDFSDLASELYSETRLYLIETNVKLKTLTQINFEKENLQILELYPNNEDFKEQLKSSSEIDAYFAKFEYLLKK